MFFYIVGFLLISIALFLFLLAPRNLWDGWFLMAGILVLFFAMLTNPFFTRYAIIKHIFHTVTFFSLYLAPLLVFISGTFTMTHAFFIYGEEHSHSQLIIGVLLGLTLIIVSLIHYYVCFFVDLTDEQEFIHVPDFLMMYYTCLFINYIINSLRMWLFVDEGKQDYVLILGAKIYPDGRASDALKSRIDAALDYLSRQKYLYGELPKIIASGTNTAPGSPITEADVIANYLVKNNIPKENIIKESRARNTHENFIYSKRILARENPHIETIKAVFVTNSFHLYRSQLYANMELLYQISGFGAPATLREWALNGFRDYIAVLFMHRKFHFVMSIFLLILGWLNYNYI